MKILMKRFLCIALALALFLSLCPSVVQEAKAAAASVNSSLPQLNTPSKQEIRAKWNTVTTASTIFETQPSITAPYKTGSLTDDFLQSGITYLNYVRYVAGLPEVSLNKDSNAQYGAVVLAAIDQLTHYPSQPSDMDDTFYEKGYSATTTSNISARYGYSPESCLQGAIQGQMDDSSSVSNLSSVGHRRWLLNPTLGKVGFGYAANSSSRWQYIVVPVFDRSGAGCAYEFISWPAAGNQPTNIFSAAAPWSITLNPSLYKQPSLSQLSVTLTRKSDGKKWSFDANTGAPANTSTPYLTVENSGYGISNCIIFHPGTSNIASYSGVYTVDVTGLTTTTGESTGLHYEVDFFDVNAPCDHNYEATVTQPTCTEKGYTTHTCTLCGETYVDSYVDATGHQTQLVNYKEATCTEPGYTGDAICTVCTVTVTVGSVIAPTGHKSMGGVCINCGLPCPPTPVNELFSDVPADAWFTEAVQYAVDNRLMNGMGEDQFRPNATMNRAMLVTILWRYAGSPTGYSHSFTDATEDWYEDAVAWANAKGIVQGISETKFGPKQDLTRQQMATILYRYCQAVGIDTAARADLSTYPDGSKVEVWAKDAMSWAVGTGLISGMDKGGALHLVPGGNATRAQVATIFMRFIENVIG